MCFPDFIGPAFWIAVLRKARTEKIPEQSEMISSGQPAGPPCSKRSGNPIPLPPKSGKTALHFRHKKCRPFQACIPVPFRNFILRKAHRFGRCRPPAGWQDSYPFQEAGFFLLPRFHSCQQGFPVPCQFRIRNLLAADGLVGEHAFGVGTMYFPA